MDYIRKNSNYSVVAACIAVMFYYGCRSAEEFPEKVFSQFPATYTLEGTAVNPGFPVTHGFLDIYDSLLVMFIFSYDGKDLPLHIYNKNDFSLIASAGPRGRGPGETVNPGDFTIDKATGDIWLVDFGQAAMLKYNIRDILNGNTSYSEKVSMPSQFAFHPAYHHGGFYYIDHTRPSNLLSFFNLQGNVVDSLIIPDKVDLYNLASGPEISPPEYAKLSCYFVFRPDMKRLAIAYRYSDVIAITDMEGKIIVRSIGPDFTPIENFRSDNKVLLYQYGVRSDSTLIYALYRNAPSIKDEQTLYPKGKVHVFNWEGEPICEINTKVNILSFVIDNENSRLITFEQVEGNIVWYDLPEF